MQEAWSSGLVPRQRGRPQSFAHGGIAVGADADGDTAVHGVRRGRGTYEQGNATGLEKAIRARRLVAARDERRHETRRHRFALRDEPRRRWLLATDGNLPEVLTALVATRPSYRSQAGTTRPDGNS